MASPSRPPFVAEGHAVGTARARRRAFASWSPLAVGALASACGGLAADGELPEPLTRLDRTLAAIVDDLSAMPESDRRFARYLLLADHDNGALSYLSAPGSGDDDALARARAFERDRQGASELANSVSTTAAIHVPEALAADDHILRIDQRDYGWARSVDVAGTLRADGWDAIVGAAALPLDLAGPHADRIVELTGSARPLLFVNDFLGVAPTADLYYGLLALPDTLAALQNRLASGVLAASGAPAAEATTVTKAYRAGFDSSGVTRVTRAVERRVSMTDASRGYWQAFDFLDDDRAGAVFSDPLEFTPDGTQVIFTLPNGLQGFYLAGAAGERIAHYEPFGFDPYSGYDYLPSTFASCFGCHNSGAVVFQDQVRSRYLAGDPRVTPGERDEILETYPAEDEMDRLLGDANRSYARALEQLGDDTFGSDSVSFTYAQSLRGTVNLQLAASMLFATPDELLAMLPESSLAHLEGVDRVGVGPRKYREAYTELFCALQRDSLNRLASCR
ncbi:MAG TPA: hypothetical protein VMG12_31000 [Polyangiaceae bacterium]|nr:hypothetical protein [Polyangiaceae bacterium]